MDELYSNVNRSQIVTSYEIKQPQQDKLGKQEQEQHQVQYADIETTSSFPNDGTLTYQHRTRNNHTYQIDTISSVEQNNNNNNKNQVLEVNEHQQQIQSQPQKDECNLPTEIATENYTIRMQPFEKNNSSINWSDCDTYLHIFLTFFFGVFTAILFFDGVLLNIKYLIIFDRPIFYTIFIIFSIGYLAFTVWMLTILWRWWRNISLLPHETNYVSNAPLLKKQQKLIARNYVFIAAIILIIGLLVYLALGIIDIYIKAYHRNTMCLIDISIFIIRLILWFIAIIALLALNRSYFYDNFMPKKCKNNKNEQTIVYEIRQ